MESVTVLVYWPILAYLLYYYIYSFSHFGYLRNKMRTLN
jgi:hypothetical protein